jgi:hypothetical protein
MILRPFYAYSSRMVLLPYAAPSTGAFGETNRQDSRFACVAPEGRDTRTYRVSSPRWGRAWDAARRQREKESLLSILVESDKFAWSEFEQPKAGPKGESQGWLS